jgi:hypothetical protein
MKSRLTQAAAETKIPDTTPIENVVGHTEFWEKAYRPEVTKFERPLVKFHIRKLGRQSTTFTNDHRLWVWIRPTWTVFVGNAKGVCFEVPSGTKPKQAWAAWREYLALMRA